MTTMWDGISQFQPQYPWPFPIGAGDTFNFLPGCDKSLGSQGCSGFNNVVNFLGEPFVPVPEVQIS
jgi:hypothetical protein